LLDTAKRQKNKPLTTRIEVVPEYFDESVYNNKAIAANIDALDSIDESFAFLSVGHWLAGQLGEDRKNLSGLLHCFFNTYKNTKNTPALILKTSGSNI
jgi:hypothetical protein